MKLAMSSILKTTLLFLLLTGFVFSQAQFGDTTYLNPHLPGSLDPLIPVKLVPPYHFVLTPILI
jgi:hypothetical protein